MTVFTAEYALRFWSSSVEEEYSRPLLGKIKFVFSAMPFIDLAAIAPFYLPFIGVDLRFVRVARMFRLFRLLKLGRYSRAVKTIGRVLRKKKEELVVSMVAMLFMLVFSSGVMYYIERDGQPEVFSSIPSSMWWGVATLTTAGYGDTIPKTALGKLIGGLILVLGVGMFALPTGILGGAFMQEIQAESERKEDERNSSEKRKTYCSHCGERII